MLLLIEGFGSKIIEKNLDKKSFLLKNIKKKFIQFTLKPLQHV